MGVATIFSFGGIILRFLDHKKKSGWAWSAVTDSGGRVRPLRGMSAVPKTEGAARSRHHTLICLKRGAFTIQSAGVRRNPVKAEGGCVNDKRWRNLTFCWFFFLSLEQGLPNFLVFTRSPAFYLNTCQWGSSCINKAAQQAGQREASAFISETMTLWSPPSDNK